MTVKTIKRSSSSFITTHETIDRSIAQAKQFIGNASINLPEYRTGGFRAMELRRAIECLERAERQALYLQLTA